MVYEKIVFVVERSMKVGIALPLGKHVFSAGIYLAKPPIVVS